MYYTYTYIHQTRRKENDETLKLSIAEVAAVLLLKKLHTTEKRKTLEEDNQNTDHQTTKSEKASIANQNDESNLFQKYDIAFILCCMRQ